MLPEVAAEIKKYFKKERFGQMYVAERLNVSQSAISRIMGNNLPMSYGAARKWSTAFGFDVNWLISGQGQMMGHHSTDEYINNIPDNIYLGNLHSDTIQLSDNAPDEVRVVYAELQRLLIEVRKNRYKRQKEIGELIVQFTDRLNDIAEYELRTTDNRILEVLEVLRKKYPIKLSQKD